MRERNTRQLIAAVIFYVSMLKGGLAVDLFEKGFGLGNAHPLSTKACVSVLATSLFRQIVFTSCALFATAQQPRTTAQTFPHNTRRRLKVGICLQ